MPDQKPNMREKNRRRPCRVNVRFTPEDYAHLREQALIANRTPAAHTRGLAKGIHLREIQRFPEEIQRALKVLGSDLNELAHQANIRHVRKEEVRALRGEVRALLEALAAGRNKAPVTAWKSDRNGRPIEASAPIQRKEDPSDGDAQ